jgi:EAL domain-containing protein (putative c-di-GMP-specific phosphodiesterase class I)
MLDEKGEIAAPNEFITAAERYGSITKIDCCLIETFFSIYHKLLRQQFISKGLYSNPK